MIREDISLFIFKVYKSTGVPGSSAQVVARDKQEAFNKLSTIIEMYKLRYLHPAMDDLKDRVWIGDK